VDGGAERGGTTAERGDGGRRRGRRGDRDALEQSHCGPWSHGMRRPSLRTAPAPDLDQGAGRCGVEQGGAAAAQSNGGRRRGRRGGDGWRLERAAAGGEGVRLGSLCEGGGRVVEGGFRKSGSVFL
jgi:hypothetical protein